jgi:hypothetical protein
MSVWVYECMSITTAFKNQILFVRMLEMTSPEVGIKQQMIAKKKGLVLLCLAIQYFGGLNYWNDNDEIDDLEDSIENHPSNMM